MTTIHANTHFPEALSEADSHALKNWDSKSEGGARVEDKRHVVIRVLANGMPVHKTQKVPVNASVAFEVSDGRLTNLRDSLTNLENSFIPGYSTDTETPQYEEEDPAYQEPSAPTYIEPGRKLRRGKRIPGIERMMAEWESDIELPEEETVLTDDGRELFERLPLRSRQRTAAVAG